MEDKNKHFHKQEINHQMDESMIGMWMNYTFSHVCFFHLDMLTLWHRNCPLSGHPPLQSRVCFLQAVLDLKIKLNVIFETSANKNETLYRHIF